MFSRKCQFVVGGFDKGDWRIVESWIRDMGVQAGVVVARITWVSCSCAIATCRCPPEVAMWLKQAECCPLKLNGRRVWSGYNYTLQDRAKLDRPKLVKVGLTPAEQRARDSLQSRLDRLPPPPPPPKRARLTARRSSLGGALQTFGTPHEYDDYI